MTMKLYQLQSPKLLYLANITSRTSGRVDDGRLKDEENQASLDSTDRLPRELAVRRFDLFCFAFSVITYLFDVATDLIVAYIHYTSERYWAFTYIIVLAMLPSVLLNLVSLMWWIDDTSPLRTGAESRCTSRRAFVFRILCYVFQLGPLLWYFEAFSAGVNFRKTDDEAEKRRLYCEMVMADRDASLLRFFEAFLESIPQVLIQGIVMAEILNSSLPDEKLPITFYVQVFSIFTSLLSACWSVSIQHRNLRIARQDKTNMNVLETFLQLAWRFLTIFSRYSCLVLFAVTFRYWIVTVFVLHYILSIIHIIALQSMSISLESNSLIIRSGLVLICAFVHLFTPFNMAEGATRWRYLVAYTLEVVEDTFLVALVLRCNLVVFPLKYAIATVSAVSFIVGILIMLLYYSKFHPNRRRLPSVKLTAKKQTATNLDIDFITTGLKHVDSDDSLDGL